MTLLWHPPHAAARGALAVRARRRRRGFRDARFRRELGRSLSSTVDAADAASAQRALERLCASYRLVQPVRLVEFPVDFRIFAMMLSQIALQPSSPRSHAPGRI